MVSTSAPCSPTTARPTAPASSARPVSTSASVTTSPAPTLHAPTARQNALSRPPCVSGPTFAIGPTPRNAINTCNLGCTTTTSPARMVVSPTLRLSAGPILPVQRLDSPQPPADRGSATSQIYCLVSRPPAYFRPLIPPSNRCKGSGESERKSTHVNCFRKIGNSGTHVHVGK